MPTCWFILTKFYVRIDHVVVKCRETRLFHKFGEVDNEGRIILHMDVTWREKDLSREGPSAGSIMRTKYGKNNTNDLPIINQIVGIPEFTTVSI